MSDLAESILSRPLTAEEAARRDIFVTACMVLDEATSEDLLAHGIIAHVGEWRGFQFKQLSWVERHCARAGADALPFDRFWLLVEAEHAGLQARRASRAAEPPSAPSSQP